jgi:hypothetical protein
MTELKLYQVGTFAAGNRLLDASERTEQSDATRSPRVTGPAAAAGRRWQLASCSTPPCGRVTAGWSR